MMGWYHDGLGWGGWILMTMAMVAFWALVVFAVIAIFRGTQRSSAPTPDHRNPLQILDERFARGEIDEDEYHARSSVLRASLH
jgi:putative membrane protein